MIAQASALVLIRSKRGGLNHCSVLKKRFQNRPHFFYSFQIIRLIHKTVAEMVPELFEGLVEA
ncbi:hypothetical protein ACT74_05035 [Aggregatibacter actinomycetemcomitans]|nr:hypothetical protein ACT74_05035 [Aggregatibacter actinomycetemcomitans]